MKRKDFFKNLAALVAAPKAVALAATAPLVPGINGESFTFTLNDKWYKSYVPITHDLLVRVSDNSIWHVSDIKLCNDEGKLWTVVTQKVSLDDEIVYMNIDLPDANFLFYGSIYKEVQEMNLKMTELF